LNDSPLRIVVVGSVNLDLVASGVRLPLPGETVAGANFARHPGGKGANQALAARRLGANVSLIGRVGRGPFATEALALVRAAGIELSQCGIDETAHTGVALIVVGDNGENQIVVAPGANARLASEHLALPPHDALICQLEVPVATVARAVELSESFVCVNLAPAIDVPDAVLERADLLVVNETEAAFFGERLQRARGLVAKTLGARGAELWRGGEKIASATPPPVQPVDTTGAGDAFVAALVVDLLRREPPETALRFACAAGAAATQARGAQPSLPTRTVIYSIAGI
jgi:ribokinase